MYQWTGDMLAERQRAYKSMRDVQGGVERPDVQSFNPEYPSLLSIVVF